MAACSLTDGVLGLLQRPTIAMKDKSLAPQRSAPYDMSRVRSRWRDLAAQASIFSLRCQDCAALLWACSTPLVAVLPSRKPHTAPPWAQPQLWDELAFQRRCMMQLALAAATPHGAVLRPR